MTSKTENKNTKNLTKDIISKLPNESGIQVVVWDSKVQGLHIKVGKNSKTFFFRKRLKGRYVSIKLGRFPEISVEIARKSARAKHFEMQEGKNPKDRLQMTKLQATELTTALDTYLANRIKNEKLKHPKEFRATFYRHLSDWMSKPVSIITADMVLKRHNSITKKAGPYAANKAFTSLQSVLKYHFADNDIYKNPVKILTTKEEWNPCKARKNYIQPHQMQTWYTALIEDENAALVNLLKLILYSGLRKTEAMTLTWRNVDFDNLILYIPKTKNGKPHILPITDNIFELLKLQQSTANESSWVFPSESSKSGHIEEPKKLVERIEERCGLRITCHDLRRTFSELAYQRTASESLVSRLLNHSQNKSVTGRHYIQGGIEVLRKPLSLIQYHTDKLMKIAEPNEKMDEILRWHYAPNMVQSW
ncbi:MAG: integrase family protein [Rickettsiales bacterium]|nr:integrase family protein [Rickettsiales bacterium]